MPDNTNSPTFELGLVMAGAVSAGAYTAGVMDFLIQALDAWHTAKQERPTEVPPHNVSLKVLSGASAGGMTAGIAAAVLGGDAHPVTEVPGEGKPTNKLYDCWVEQIDIQQLLGHEDLKDGKPVRSLLDSTALDCIAETVFRVQPRSNPRPYVADPLHLYLSVANLRGVPYRISFQGAAQEAHRVVLHADYMQFALSDKNPEIPGALFLDRNDLEGDSWKLLAQAALASGAFPVGLAPRQLVRPAGDYRTRDWAVPLDEPRTEDGDEICQEMRRVDPDWKMKGDHRYDFLCVDGGLMNNEPLELAREQLAPRKSGRNERHPSRARRAVLMIDPFPSEMPETDGYDVRDALPQVVTQMFSALKAQARFKPDELMLATREDVYSRFMIAPVREEAGATAEYPLACGSLGAFGGFLSKDFRVHDFFLGRRNCQRFLQRWFALPADAGNPLFTDWTDDMKDQFTVERDGKRFFPIIPVVGEEANRPVELPDWPTYTQTQLQELKGRVEDRANHVVKSLIGEYVDGRLASLAACLFWMRKRGAVLKKIAHVIESDLKKRNLLA